MRHPGHRPSVLVGLALLAASCVPGCSSNRLDPWPTNPEILLDGESRDGAVSLTWNTTFTRADWALSTDITPPRTVLLQVSAEGPESGYRLVAERPGGIADSLVVPGLVNGRTYHFRAVLLGGDLSPLVPTAPIAVMPGVFERISASHDLDTWDWKGIAWSPDSREIAFVRSSRPLPELRALDVATGGDRLLLSGPAFVTIGEPAWSPDGSRIAFSSSPTLTAGEIDYRIWTVGRDGTGARSWSPGRVDFGAAWANSESTLVFCRGTYEPPNVAQLFRLEMRGDGAIARLSQDASLGKNFPEVRRSDGRILFTGTTARGRSGLYTMPLAGGAIHPLLVSRWWDDFFASWSPDGRRVVFTSTRAGHPDVWVLDPATGATRQLTTARGDRESAAQARWSPDGTRIAAARHGTGGYFRLDVLDAP